MFPNPLIWHRIKLLWKILQFSKSLNLKADFSVCSYQTEASHGKDSTNWSLITAEADELLVGNRRDVAFYSSARTTIPSDRFLIEPAQIHRAFRNIRVSLNILFLDFRSYLSRPRSRIRFYPSRKIHRYRFVYFVIFFTIFRSIEYLWSRKCLIPWCSLEMEKKN